MRNIIKYIIFFSLGLCTGPQTVYVVQNASLLANSSTGIALNHNLNPANIVFNDKYISFSKNNSIHDLEGQKVSILNTFNGEKTFFSFENLSSSSIPIYEDSPPPDDNPVGYFDTYWYAVEFSQSFKFNKDFDPSNIILGYKIRANLYKLFTEKSTNYSFDIGFRKKINNRLDIGLVLNNVGGESFHINNQVTGAYDGKVAYGLGVNYNIPNAYIHISSDVYYRNSKVINKISLKTDFPYLNLVFGKTVYSGYSDFSYGLNLDLAGWKFVYGYLSFNDNAIGNPSSIQIIREF